MSQAMGESMGRVGAGGLAGDGGFAAAFGPAVRPASSLRRADFDAMAAMEARFYGEDLITPAKEAWRWYERYPFTTVAARATAGGEGADGGDPAGGGASATDQASLSPRPSARPRRKDATGSAPIAGFVNLFPVTAPVHDALLTGSFNDANLTVEDVVDPWGQTGEGGPAAPLHMFLSCVVVDVPWQGTGLAYLLIARAAAQYAEHARCIADIIVDTATPDGAKLARNLGFSFVRPSDHGTQIWYSTWEAFISKLAR